MKMLTTALIFLLKSSTFHWTLAPSNDLFSYLLFINLYKCFQCIIDLQNFMLKGVNTSCVLLQPLNSLNLIKLEGVGHVDNRPSTD